MAIKENINVIKNKEEKYQNNKVSNLAYSDTAYDENIVNGNPDYSEEAEQNIPLGTAENMHLPQVMLDKGQRAQASFLFRSMTNHFLGRASYNLNKIHDYFLSLLQSITSFIAMPNGVATLDSKGRIPVSQEPEDSINLLGTWNAETNTPTLQDGTGTKGDVYLVSVEGEQDLGSGEQYFFVKDKVVYQNGVWSRIPVGEFISLNGSFETDRNIEINGSQINMSSADTRALNAAINSKVPLTSTIQNKTLDNSIKLYSSEINKTNSISDKIKDLLNSLVSKFIKINNKSLETDIVLTGEDIKDGNTTIINRLSSFVSPDTEINAKALDSNVNLTGEDILVVPNGVTTVKEAIDSATKTKEYTYIVDSQDSLDYWLSNKAKGNSSGGSDFTSVFIKYGDWQFTGNTVALDVLGTVSIDAEAGTKLTCDSLRYNTLLYDTQKHIRNLELSGTLENVCNVNNCIGKSIKLFTTDSNWSTDGKNWTEGTGITATVSAVTYANGLWCTGRFWSTDGKNWTEGTGITATVRAITYANGLWCTGAYWSTDGKNWTRGTRISTTVLAITYANGLWCTGAYWSTDGKNWTAGTGITAIVRAITYIKVSKLQIKDSLSVQNCTATFKNSYATPEKNEDYNCSEHPEAGFNIAI